MDAIAEPFGEAPVIAVLFKDALCARDSHPATKRNQNYLVGIIVQLIIPVLKLPMISKSFVYRPGSNSETGFIFVGCSNALRLIAAASFVFFISSAGVGAQTAPAGQASSAPLPNAPAAAVTGTIVIDGKLDEGAWAKATPITELRRRTRLKA